jgi:hypothetical protein
VTCAIVYVTCVGWVTLAARQRVAGYGDVLDHHLDPPDDDPDDVMVIMSADTEMSRAVTRAACDAAAVGGVT